MAHATSKQSFKNAIRSQQDYEELQQLRALWVESEEVLRFVRTVSGPASEPDAGLLRRWEMRIVPASPVSPWAPEPDRRTPNGWFETRFPYEVAGYGQPFLQHQHTDRDGFLRTALMAINEDFFAAILGGDKAFGHQVVFYDPEKTFYFWDCAREMFIPTTPAKLKLLVSNYFIKCAQSMTTLVNVEPLYGTLRSEKCLRSIIEKAEAMHAAGEDFFSDGRNVRIDRPAKGLVPKLFVKETLAKQPKAVLTVNNLFEDHLKFAEVRGLTPLQRKEFKGLIAEVIREEFGVGLRNDLRSEDGRAAQGWSNLAVRREVLLAN